MLSKHGLDIGRCDVSVVNGSCHIRGLISAAKGWKIADVPAATEHIAQLIRQKFRLRNVVVDISTPYSN